MKLHILLLTALPLCLAEFSIQGPSDGHRRAQGLKFSEEKGIEYTDASEGGGPGDFSIQGATDGNSNFRIQGATDGHTNFQIQGPSEGGAATFNVQPPVHGHGQSIIQGAYDANQGAYDANQGAYDANQGTYDANQVNAKALQYNDPSGYRVNWRSYDRQPAQAAPQYTAQAAAPVPQAAPRQRAHRPQRVQPQRQQQVDPVPSYKHYGDAPPQIQQLLHFQQQIPYINIIPEPYRFDEQAAIQAQAEQVREHLRNLVPQPPPGPAPAPEPRQKSRGHSRNRREARPQHQQPQYRRVSQPPAEPQPNYSPNLPPHLRELLVYQAQIPHNIIANQIVYRPEKPYVPHRVDPSQQQQQPIQQAQYQGQGGAYEAQASAYTQAHITGYNPGPQPGYNQPGVRPVTENQY